MIIFRSPKPTIIINNENIVKLKQLALNLINIKSYQEYKNAIFDFENFFLPTT